MLPEARELALSASIPPPPHGNPLCSNAHPTWCRATALDALRGRLVGSAVWRGRKEVCLRAPVAEERLLRGA